MELELELSVTEVFSGVMVWRWLRSFFRNESQVSVSDDLCGKLKVMDTGEEFCLRAFSMLNGRKRRLYCRPLKERRGEAAIFRLYEDFRGGQWLEMEVGCLNHMEELVGETFEQRVAADLLALGLNKYSG